MPLLSPRIRLALRVVVLAAGALAVFLFLFAWSGLYSIAASRGHWAVVEWFLTFGMRNSVKTHALGIEVPPLDGIDLVTLGAGHFHGGCAFCHGAPGLPRNPVALSMLPPPPNLQTSMRPWHDRELFWIVRHGIKYTGMPAWPADRRDDEVWAVAAFLRRLPGLDAGGYRALAFGGLHVPAQSGTDLATRSTDEAVGACARCHGAGARGPASRLVPILHGQPAEFLKRALDSYAAGRRASGIMQPPASDLAPGEAHRVADYYAGLRPPARPSPASDTPAVERGRALAERGDPDRRIPACRNCHDAAALPIYPRLAGQHQAYMANRLRLWKNGLPPGTDTETIMAPIGRLLDARQIEDVTAYFASLAAPASGAQP
jgi:cytochrome c553